MATEHRRQLMREYNRRYRERNPEKRAESLKKYNNSDKARANRKRWAEANPDMDVAAKKAYQERNREISNEKSRIYARENPEWKTAQCAKRRSKKLNAMPDWLDEDDLWLIKEVYKFSKVRTKITGIKYTVDHIIPLQGKDVCGLHVPFNLQVIPATENSRKNNRTDYAYNKY